MFRFGRFFFTKAAAPVTPLLNVDFSGYTLGPKSAASILSDTGLTFVRSTGSTVQTSASTLDETPGVDDGCIGSLDGTFTGLVIQHNTRNGLGGTTSPRDLTNAWLGGGGHTVTYPFADSPNVSVTGCSRTSGASGSFAPYGDAPASSRRNFSSWQRSFDSGTNGDMQQVWITAAPGDGLQVVRAASDTWARLSLASGAVFREYLDVCDCRDYTGSGGQTARARDVLVDYIQLELGDFPTEAIPGASDYRSNDRLSYAVGSDLVQSGHVKFYAKFYPKHSSTMNVYYNGSSSFSGAAGAWYLWSFNGVDDDYALIDPSTKQLSVRIGGGTVITSTNAISWSQYDEVEVYIEVGNGDPSIARYSINGAAWLDLSLGVLSNPATPAGDFTFFASDVMGLDTADSGHLPCWLSNVIMYGDATTPVHLPMLDSIDFDLGDPLGADTIVITGVGFTNVTDVLFDVTSAASFIIDSDTQITVVTPAHADGSAPITVTITAYTSNSLPFEFWSPLTPGSVTSFMESPDYSISGSTGTWAARSGVDASKLTTYPDDSPTGTPNFIAANLDTLEPSTSGWLSLIDTSSAVSATIAVILDVTSLSGIASNIICDNSFYGTIFFTPAPDVAFYYFDSGYKNATISGIPSSGRFILVAERDSSGTPFVKLTSMTSETVTWTNSATVGNLNAGTAGMAMGYITALSLYPYDGKMKTLVTAKTGWSDAEVTKFYKWANIRHP